MKKPLLILITFLVSNNIHAQNCKYFEDLLHKSQSLWKAGKFEQAINQLAAAREDCPSKGNVVDRYLIAFTNEIAKKYREAEVERSKAQTEAFRADSVAEVNRKATLTEYANALAYKSKIALQEGDRNTAFRLAEFAELYVEEGNPRVFQALFNAYYANYRINEDILLRPANLEGHLGFVLSVDFSPDGDFVATGGGDSTAIIWSAKTGQIIHRLRCDIGSIKSIDFSPDGKYLATSADHGVQFWDVKNGAKFSRIGLPGKYVGSLAYSPSGDKIAITASDSITRIFEVHSYSELFRTQTNSAYNSITVFSPDGNYIATISDEGHAKIWNVQNGKEIFSFKTRLKQIGIGGMAFSPDGKRIALGINEENCIRIFDVESLDTLLTIYRFAGISCLEFSPDGQHLVAGSGDNTMKIWDSETGEMQITIKGHTGPVSGISFSSDGRFLASSSWDRTAKVWDLKPDTNAFILVDTVALIHDIALSPDGSFFATTQNNSQVKIWNSHDANDQRTCIGHTDTVISVAFSKSGNHVASCSLDSTIRIWNVQDGTTLKVLSGHLGGVHCLDFSPDGKHLVSVSRDQTVKIWDIDKGNIIKTIAVGGGAIYSVAISPSGKFLATGGEDKKVYVWNIEEGRLVKTIEGNTDRITSLAFSPDGRYLASGAEFRGSAARVWDWEKSKLIATLQDIIAAPFASKEVAFSPDGKRLAVAFANESLIEFNLETGNPVLRLRGSCVSYSADNKMMATGTWTEPIVWYLNSADLDSIWHKNGPTAPMTRPQLEMYGLENLLSMNLENEARLIATHDVWQIYAFANLTHSLAISSNILDKSNPLYTRADRLYASALSIQNEPLIRRSYARLLRKWAEVYRSEGIEPAAILCESKADTLWFKE